MDDDLMISVDLTVDCDRCGKPITGPLPEHPTDPDTPGEALAVEFETTCADCLRDADEGESFEGEVIHAIAGLSCHVCGGPIEAGDLIHAEDGAPLVHRDCHTA